jgi:hypothetical protein
LQINNVAINKKQECGLLFVESNTNVTAWQKEIVRQVERWVGKSNTASNRAK